MLLWFIGRFRPHLGHTTGSPHHRLFGRATPTSLLSVYMVLPFYSAVCGIKRVFSYYSMQSEKKETENFPRRQKGNMAERDRGKPGIIKGVTTAAKCGMIIPQGRGGDPSGRKNDRRDADRRRIHMQPIRIQKALSEAGVASRRRAEELVREGRVTVNGRRAEIGQSVNPDRDVVAVDGRRVYFARKKQYRYLMMNKPRGYITTLSDELGRRCVTDLLAGVEERVYPIGRLDRNSEGLLLFTNDGELANRIMHPASHINKVYRVTVRPDVTDEQAAELSAGVKIGENTTTLPATVLIVEKQPGRVVLQITISEGKNRQIRRMCEAVGLEVVRLKRIAVGPIKLGMLQPGRWRDLRPAELMALRGAVTNAAGGEAKK